VRRCTGNVAPEMDGALVIEKATQLAIMLPDEPGRLAHICHTLANADVNICALTVLETWGGKSTVRVVVNDTARALECFETEGLSALETEVLLIEAANKPGVLGRIAEQLSAANINIEYAYVAVGQRAEKAWIILRPSNIDEAQEILARAPG
jgi:hypothetical protein